MYNKITLTVLCVIVINFVTGLNLRKCCEREEKMSMVDSMYKCVEDNDKRLQINAEKLGNTTEDCVEVVDDGFVHQFHPVANTDEFVRKSYVNLEDFHRKCCPVGWSYKSNTHSCSKENATNNEEFSEINFVKIGLPHCKIIIDYHFNSIQDISFENGHLFLPNNPESFPRDSYCLDRNQDEKLVVRICKTSLDVCEQFKCLRKCCPDGQSFVNGSNCQDTHVHGVDLRQIPNVTLRDDDAFALVHGYISKVYPARSKFYLDENAVFYLYNNKTAMFEEHPLEKESYCIEHGSKISIKFYKFALFQTYKLKIPNIPLKILINRWVFIISSIFLTLTIAIYIISKEIASVFGKTLVSFCLSFLLLCIFIAYSAFNSYIPKTPCKIIGFTIVYFEISSFVWLNIMCLDIYWTFGSSAAVHRKKNALKRFLFYSLYGWGCPLMITAFLLQLYFFDIVPVSLQIKIGERHCYFEKENYAELMFVTVPLTIIEILNIFLFIKTITYCLKVKGEIRKMSDAQNLKSKQQKFIANKERLGLILKLAVIMGISLLFEIVSSFYDFGKHPATKWVEIIWDCLNGLQGVFIFIIFICKKKILNKFSKNVGVDFVRRKSSSAVTRTSNIWTARGQSKDSKEQERKEENNE